MSKTCCEIRATITAAADRAAMRWSDWRVVLGMGCVMKNGFCRRLVGVVQACQKTSFKLQLIEGVSKYFALDDKHVFDPIAQGHDFCHLEVDAVSGKNLSQAVKQAGPVGGNNG